MQNLLIVNLAKHGRTKLRITNCSLKFSRLDKFSFSALRITLSGQSCCTFTTPCTTNKRPDHKIIKNEEQNFISLFIEDSGTQYSRRVGDVRNINGKFRTFLKWPISSHLWKYTFICVQAVLELELDLARCGHSLSILNDNRHCYHHQKASRTER